MADDVPWTTLQIETERLRLRAFRDSDRPTILAMETDDQVTRYLGGPADEATVAQIASATLGRQPGVFCLADRTTDRALGRVSLGHQHDEAEVSYALLPDSWGKGLAGEAVAAFLDWFWDNHSEDSMIAVTQTANARSRKLLDRLGFGFETEFEEWQASQSQYRLDRPDSVEDAQQPK